MNDDLLLNIAARVRALRVEKSLTRQELARISGVSLRFLAQVEAGQANISILRLQEVAQSLGTTIHTLLEPSRSHFSSIALLGLRGAGKSTVGARLAGLLEIPFCELDQLVETRSGLRLDEIFELQGEGRYRQLERDALSHFVASSKRALLATGGGIVTEPSTYALLRRSCVTIWLRAGAEDHWNRVVQQGDQRPMQGKPQAMHELELLLKSREPLYAQADYVFDTGRLCVSEIARGLQTMLQSVMNVPGMPDSESP